ncbi:hypothetical protein E2C01_035009 [Portunus trituberculatus]|uniref:Uncharacterized protein n=1 Tax=Portunus trituberculatus TaxID=210409 RepID=A0A5B7F863_PORTR|nr:hypothetical protein [Portunus trituberculatus]
MGQSDDFPFIAHQTEDCTPSLTGAVRAAKEEVTDGPFYPVIQSGTRGFKGEGNISKEHKKIQQF